MRQIRMYALALASLAVAVVIGCAEPAAPTSAPLERRGDAADILEDIYVTAPYTYYCLNYACRDGGGTYIADLTQWQVRDYCRNTNTSEYCFFDEGGGNGYTSANPTMNDDFNDTTVPTLSEPDCSNLGALQPLEKVWCQGTPITAGTKRYTRVQAALDKIKALGGYCLTLGNEGQRLLDAGVIRTYKPSAKPGTGGFATRNLYGSEDAYMALSDHYTDIAFDNNHVEWVMGNKVNLQLILAHELDHVAGATGHLSETKAGALFTANTATCSGQGAPKNI